MTIMLCLVLALSLVACGSKATTDESVVMSATIADIGADNEMDALYVTANGKNFVIYNWKNYVADGVTLNNGDDVEITYNGIATEEEPSGLCGVMKIVGK